MINLVKK
jgi:hypothetical protein